MSKQIIIGLAGTFASGKDTLANWLADKHGIKHISTSDLVREDTQKIYGSTDRPILHKHANELRETKGPGVLAEMALERSGGDNVVISGIRSIGEAEFIQQAGGMIVFVDANPKVRYKRASSRNRDVEQGMSFEEFMASEKKELQQSTTDKGKFNILGIKDMADIILTNDNEADDLFRDAAAELGLEESA